MCGCYKAHWFQAPGHLVVKSPSCPFRLLFKEASAVTQQAQLPFGTSEGHLKARVQLPAPPERFSGEGPPNSPMEPHIMAATPDVKPGSPLHIVEVQEL